MDRLWDHKLWKPSSTPLINSGGRLPKKAIEDLQNFLITTTKNIGNIPYLHAYWQQRSVYLMQLGYPELAAADAYKSVLLCNAGLDSASSLGDAVRFITAMHSTLVDDVIWGLDEKVAPKMINGILRMAQKASYSILIDSMMELGAFPEVIKTCTEVSTLYPLYSSEFETVRVAAQSAFNNLARMLTHLPFHEQKILLSFGRYCVRNYPWLPVDYRTRGRDSIQVANQNLKQVSDCLELRPSFIGGKVSNTSDGSCYGVFATKKISKGQTIISETHPFAVSLEQPKTHCGNCFTDLATCGTIRSLACCSIYLYCRERCETSAWGYHKSMCGKDFSEIIDNAHKAYGGKDEGEGYPMGKTALSHFTGWADKVGKSELKDFQIAFPDHTPVILARFLALIIQDGCDPLDHSSIVPLVAHNDTSNMTWSLNGMVSGPMTALQILGVDIFADTRFDTWVLLTMWSRIRNNCMEADIAVPNKSLSPSYSWFNHSCAPNAERIAARSGSACDMEMKALKTIKKGEEIFVTYISTEILALKKTERHAALRAWFGSACKCQRCLRER
ncbi:uncharacterized protein RSE6_02604 [Rhynchosporium secalis]|uniref:Uncharacterized protein n=1 Tax=Rhynchosporium secalis TaxID=38038 RepID=A0A1E1M0N6_RHYSE|nr:uncharacterized protein RSE6_02604 [Rhynchosporium secalis]